MTTSIKSSPDGTQAIIQVNGADKVVVDSGGINAGSYKAGSVAVADLATAAKPLGEGQTWQSFTVGSGRVSGTTYTNSTGRSIFVVPTLAHGGGTFFTATFTIGGVVVAYMNSGNASYSVSCPYGFIVPAGESYRLDITGGGGTLSYWAELR